MSGVHLRGVLPRIYRLFADGPAAGLSDAALLSRFREGGDESAFPVLVARHGPMVLAVCRGVLRDESDAEDAFQAVFLVLVRRAGSIWVDESLGGWLHRVAWRVALRANAEAARRRSRERTGVAIDAAGARDAGGATPGVAALHEEIARLPPSYRQAVVLCLLEGKTQAEAAREMGCGEATVRRRLSGARERLRARLERRGLGELAIPPVPAVPTAWAEAVPRLTAGPAAALAAPVLVDMTRTQFVRIAAVLATLTLGTACALGTVLAIGPPPVREAPPNAPGRPAAAAKPEPPPASQPPPARFGARPEGEVVVPGRVVGPDGKPVAGAVVFLRGYGVRLPERKATTDALGRFRFTTAHELGWKMTQTAPNHLVMGAYPDADEIRNLMPRLIAVAPGFGFGLPAEGDEVLLRLKADDPLVGRVTDREGRPVAGARVRVRNLYWARPAEEVRPGQETGAAARRRARPHTKEGDLGPWINAVRRASYLREFQEAVGRFLTPLVDSLGDIPAAHAPLIPPVTTDADGRFRLAGIGRERVAEVIIDGHGLASTLIVAATRPIETPVNVPALAPAMKGRISNTWDDLTLFGDRVDLVAGPGGVVEGVVTDRATGQPLAGLVVHGPWRSPLEYHEYDRFQSTTDGRGRYRIEGLPVPSRGEFSVTPPDDRPYLGRVGELRIEPGVIPFKADISLRRGVWISGRVADDATGEPLRDGVVHYYPFADNPTLRKDLEAWMAPAINRDVRTDPDGKFRVVGYPGRGIVTAWDGNYLPGVGADKLGGVNTGRSSERFYPPFQFNPENVSAVVEVDAPEAGGSVSCELRLKKGKSREVRVVGPGGGPQPGTEASGLASQIENPMTGIEGDRFTVRNLSPGETREVVARLVSKKLAGMATVPYDGDGPVTLRLRPWATLTGRLVDDRGRPRSKAVEIMLDDGKLPLHTLGGRGYDRPTFPVDPDGRFRIEGLVAGPSYALQVLEAGFQIEGDVARGLVLEPGEARDLGDVSVVRETGR